MDLYINNVYATSIVGDGLIISSSTGSTAYNMSISASFAVDPKLECIILNYLAPMSLSLRPLIFSRDVEIMITVHEGSRGEPRIVGDSNYEEQLSKGRRFVVKVANTKLRSRYWG